MQRARRIDEGLLRRLPAELERALAEARRVARESRARLYLVGGAVRDLLLERPVLDVDLMVEGDGIAFARRLARRLRASAREHARFGTASMTLPGGERIDVASARAERYDAPGRLPLVTAAGLEEDLARRDFSINAIGLRIAPGAPALVDPHGGRADLARRRIRVLHPQSPFDDPTRAFRAARYAARLGFRIEAGTRRAIRRAVDADVFAGVSGDRLRREIRLVLEEPRRAAAVGNLERLGVLGAVHPALRIDGAGLGRLRRAGRMMNSHSSGGETWLACLLAWTAGIGSPEAEGLASRLRLPRREGEILRRWPETLRSGGANAGGLGADERLALRASRPEIVVREPRPLTIKGRDLLHAGVPPGPAIGRALAETRDARESGSISSDQELAYALEAARRGSS